MIYAEKRQSKMDGYIIIPKGNGGNIGMRLVLTTQDYGKESEPWRRRWRNIMVRKVKGGYKVVSKTGKSLSKVYKSKSAADKRLREIEFFKHKGR